ncbi:MAG: hypothetical protein O7A63_03600 [Acidobacteria bacterium]|nr:hypothetical protein [Acidobacteriota bacterium]
MKRTTGWIATAAAVMLGFGLAAPEASAKKLSATAIYFEINDTDGDAGIQIFLDGEGWDRMMVFDPNGNKILDFAATGSVGIQGITELFFESAEPLFDEQSLAELLALFPEGHYKFRGRTTEGVALVGKATLTHALPAGPLLVSPVEGDDSIDPEHTVIAWQLVPDPPGSRIVSYAVIVEREEPSLRVFTADLGPTTTSVTVPPEFMQPGTAYKFEVLAIEASGNQTISEREFETRE